MVVGQLFWEQQYGVVGFGDWNCFFYCEDVVFGIDCIDVEQDGVWIGCIVCGGDGVDDWQWLWCGVVGGDLCDCGCGGSEEGCENDFMD